MRKENFVPGKIYKADSSNQKYYYIGPSVFSNQGIFQRIPTGDTYSFPYESSAYEWIEHKEPCKGTRWVNVYMYSDGSIYSSSFGSKKNADRDGILTNPTKVACVEVPWVEGQGL